MCNDRWFSCDTKHVTESNINNRHWGVFYFSVPVASPLSAGFLDYHVFADDKTLFWQFGFSTLLVANLLLLRRVIGNFVKLLCSRKLEFFSSKTRCMFMDNLSPSN